MAEAEADRGDKFRDNIQDIADMPIIPSEDIKGYKLKADLYEKLAGWDNKEKFGTKRVEQAHTGALQLIINTGIDRGDKDGPKIIRSEENNNGEPSSTGGEQQSIQGHSKDSGPTTGAE